MSFNKINYIDGQTVISAKNMNDIQDEVIRLGGKEAVQSDWFEANENSLAYVKNRTHWIDWQEGELFNGVFENSDGTWVTFIENAKIPILKENSKYQVTIEEESFESTLIDVTEIANVEGLTKAYALGNLSILDSDSFLNNEEPFALIMVETPDFIIGLLVLLIKIPRETEGYRVSISGPNCLVKKLDEIYMPESYSEVKNTVTNLVNQMDECQTEINTHDNSISDIQSSLRYVLKYTTQSLTDTQKARARKNIGAISVDEVPSQPLPSHLPEAAVVEASELSPRLEFEIPDSYWSASWPSGYIAIIWDEELYDMLMTDKTLFYSFDNIGYNKLYPFNWEGAYALAPNPTDLYESFYIAPMKSDNVKAVYIKVKEKINKIFLNIAHYRMDYFSRLMSADTIPPTIARLADLTDALENLITLEDIDFICAERVKVTFPVHDLSVKISYTDAKGVFHENEDLPERYKTTYEVLKGTSIILNGNYFDETSFVLPEDNKYYTKISDSEIIPLMDFEIKYADGAPA